MFFSGRIRTLVTLATYNFQRLIMGKVVSDNLQESLGIFDFFTEMFIELYSTFHKTFVQIA